MSKIFRIAVFYDGSFFFDIGKFYAYHHERQSRISISGLHDFIRRYLSSTLDIELSFCRFVEKRYYRCRMTTNIAEQRTGLKGERIFEDVLMHNNVSTHYWPVSDESERISLAQMMLDIYDLCLEGCFDICVIVSSQRDFLPLVRRLAKHQTAVMMLGWWGKEEIENNAIKSSLRMPSSLQEEAFLTVLLDDYIDGDKTLDGWDVDDLFVAPSLNNDSRPNFHRSQELRANMTHFDQEEEIDIDENAERHFGQIILLNQGWGFIKPEQDYPDIFFYYGDLIDLTFDQLTYGDNVSYVVGTNERGPIAKAVVKL